MGPVNPIYVYIYIYAIIISFILANIKKEKWIHLNSHCSPDHCFFEKVLLDYPDSYRNVTKIRNTIKITKQSYIFATKNGPTPYDVAKRNLSSFLQKIIFFHISKGNPHF